MATLLPPRAHHRLPIRNVPWATTPAAILIESRPGVQIVFLLRFAAGCAIVRHPSLHPLACAAGWAMLTITIYVMNGVSDLAADRANQSRRPIASGRLNPATAMAWCSILALGGLLLCWHVSPLAAVVGAAFLFLGWAYSFGPALKNSSSGFAIVIGMGAALTYSAGWVAAGRHATTHGLIVAMSVSAWVGLCCASKDFSDIDGDRQAGRRTWPVIFGPLRAARLLSVLAITTAVGALVLAGGSGASLVPAAVLLAGSIALAVVTPQSASAPERVVRRRPYRTFLIAQYATNGAMLIFGTV